MCHKEPNPDRMTYIVGITLVVLSVALTALNVWFQLHKAH